MATTILFRLGRDDEYHYVHLKYTLIPGGFHQDKRLKTADYWGKRFMQTTARCQR